MTAVLAPGTKLGPYEIGAATGPYSLTFDPLSSGSISRDDRLLVPLASADDWYFLPGVVNLKTGQMTAVPVDEFADYHFVLWGPGEKSIIAGGYPTRYALWRFQADKPSRVASADR